MTRRISVKMCLITAGVMMFCSPLGAVTSQIYRHSSESDLSEGKTEDVIIDSRGTLRLGHSADVLKDDFQGIWSINSVLTRGNTVYFSTSPNGGIFRYSFGEFTRLYPLKDPSEAQIPSSDANDSDDLDAVTNEHVFALAFDMSGRLLAGFSGIDCRLCVFSSSGMEVIFRPKDAQYIFDIELDKAGNIYLATGPQGKVYSLDPLGRTAQLVYTSPDKNLLSLIAGDNGFLYAGSDSRGLIYKLNPKDQSAAVLYDSTKPEISALLLGGGQDPAARDLYAIATSAQIVKVEQEFADNVPQPGRPEPESSEENGEEEPDEEQQQDGGMSLKIANTKEEPPERRQGPPRAARRGAQPKSTSSLYRVNRAGYVTTIADKMAIFLCLARNEDRLLIGTGNNGQLLRIDPVTEQQTVLYEDKEASQITGLGLVDKDIFIGTANPAKLIRLKAAYASQGTYVSSLIDAKQPARWGKLQIDAEVPEGCTVLVSSRSGNVEDVNDPTFSPWTEPVSVTEPTQLQCPLGRFCQYKLILQSQSGTGTPVIREVAVASTIPNLAPVVEAVDVQQRPRGGRTELYEISYKTRDDNDDTLIYTIYFRKLGRSYWIQLVEDHEEDNYHWDSKTVEDGRYEIRIVANDRRSNTPDTALTGSRISDPVVIDNTGPVVADYDLQVDSTTATLTVNIKDQFTAIDKLDYAIDGNTDWHAAVPEDLVYDTTQESFTIQAKDLSPGEHVITIRASDDLDNVTYKSFDVMIVER